MPGDDVAVESLISMTNKARAEAMIAEAVSGAFNSANRDGQRGATFIAIFTGKQKHRTNWDFKAEKSLQFE